MSESIDIFRVSNASTNNCCCPTTVVVTVPGTAGISAIAYTSADFTVPAVGSPVTFSVTDSTPFVVGGFIIVGNTSGLRGTYLILAKPTSTSLTATFQGLINDVSVGSTQPNGSEVSPTGAPGQGSYSTTIGTTTPVVGVGATSIVALSTQWLAIGQTIIISNSTTQAHFTVYSIQDVNNFKGTYLAYVGDSTTPIISGSRIALDGKSFTLGTLPSAVSYGGDITPSNAITIGAGQFLMTIPVTTLSLGTAAITLMNAYAPGFRFIVEQFDFINTTVGAGAGASQIFSLAISGTNVTGGVVTTTLASTNTSVGRITAGTAITANNMGGTADTLTINMAAGGTNFTAATGSGYFVIRIKNIDEGNALASLAAAINTLINAL